MAQNNKKTPIQRGGRLMEHVNKWFGQFHVLRDINLQCKQKERGLSYAGRLVRANLP